MVMVLKNWPACLQSHAGMINHRNKINGKNLGMIMNPLDFLNDQFVNDFCETEEIIQSLGVLIYWFKKIILLFSWLLYIQVPGISIDFDVNPCFMLRCGILFF